MCLAILKTATARLSLDDLAEAWKDNSDGAGLAWHDPVRRRVEIEKGFFKLRDLWSVIEENHDKVMLVHLRFATHGSINTDNCHPFELKDGALIHNGVIPLAESLGNVKSRWDLGWGDDGDEDEAEQVSNEYLRTSGWLDPDADDDDWRVEEAREAYAAYCRDREEESERRSVVDEPSDTRLFVAEYLSDMKYGDLVKNRKMIERLISRGSKLATLHDNGRHLIFNENLGHWRSGCWYSNYGYRKSAGWSTDHATVVTPKAAAVTSGAPAVPALATAKAPVTPPVVWTLPEKVH